MNDEQRRQWISSDEGLWDAQRRSRLTMKGFIRRHRSWIDAVAAQVVSGHKPAHYLKYDQTVRAEETDPR